MMVKFRVAFGLLVGLAPAAIAFAPSKPFSVKPPTSVFSTTEENKNVAQTEDTSRDKVMTFSYDMSLEPKYDKPTYPGTGNGLSGDSGEYDVIVIGSGMGGLACGAISAKYGDKGQLMHRKKLSEFSLANISRFVYVVLVLESHIKCGGSAHTFSRMHKGGKYSFEVGPSIFEGLDRPSLNPLRMIFDLLGEEMPVKTYTGLGYWTPTGYWRFPIGSQQKFEDLLMEQAEDGPKAVEVSYMTGWGAFCQNYMPCSCILICLHCRDIHQLQGMERFEKTTQDSGRVDNGCLTP
jgi:NAD(P)-binding Rossmann-like domain